MGGGVLTPETWGVLPRRSAPEIQWEAEAVSKHRNVGDNRLDHSAHGYLSQVNIYRLLCKYSVLSFTATLCTW